MNASEANAPSASDAGRDRIGQAMGLGHAGAAEMLQGLPEPEAVKVLQGLVPSFAREILALLPAGLAQRLLAAASPESRRQWAAHDQYAEGTIGRLMETPIGVFRPSQTVGEAIETMGELVKRAFITYGFVVGDGGELLGVITMRDLLFNPREVALETVMIKTPFFLRADTPQLEAMRQTLHRHFPIYPVCDAAGRLVGLVRGQTMFEAQAIELSAQAGSMVGVEKEERLATPWQRSLKSRHPWLQLNLLTAFVAAAVVGFFEGTIERITVLAVFLPVLAGQSGNTGCQALAVALRGITLGELKPGKERRLVMKEALLGLMNGALVGLSAGLGMWVYAHMQHRPDAPLLGLIVWAAMIGSCVVSGISGALIPLGLKRLGADPATASSIFLTTATDVASMGLFLGLATLLTR